MNLKNKKCKVVFIGSGYMVCEHAKAFSGIDGVELDGIYSRTKSKTESVAKNFGINNVANSIDELYKKSSADLVVIAVSELSLGQVFKEALNYPWTILLEKPAGYSPDDSMRIYDESIGKKNKVFVALNRRHYQSTRIAIEQLKHISSARVVNVLDQEDIVTAMKIGKPEEITRNWMYVNSIHLIDYFSMFCRGTINKVSNVLRWNPGDPRIVLSTIEYSSGDIGIYTAFWNAPGPWSVSITTSEKMWQMRPLEKLSVQEFGVRGLSSVELDRVDELFKPGLRLQAIEAVKAAAGLDNGLVDLEKYMESVSLTKKIYNG